MPHDEKPVNPDALVYLVRHGRAEDSHPLGDQARALTPDGRALFRDLARKVGRGLGLRGIASSPLVRAVQTAEILARAARIDDVIIREELAYPFASPETIVRLTRELGPRFAFVGHNPSLAETVARVLALRGEPPRFRKGSIAALEPGPAGAPPWKLAWMASPGRKLETDGPSRD